MISLSKNHWKIRVGLHLTCFISVKGHIYFCNISWDEAHLFHNICTQQKANQTNGQTVAMVWNWLFVHIQRLWALGVGVTLFCYKNQYDLSQGSAFCIILIENVIGFNFKAHRENAHLELDIFDFTLILHVYLRNLRILLI